jgi:hypothetical protein
LWLGVTIMNFAVFIPIIAICCTAAIILAWMNNRHERLKWKALGRDGDRARLEAENARLQAMVERLEDRMAVLERIATDPAERTAREIEQLR